MASSPSPLWSVRLTVPCKDAARLESRLEEETEGPVPLSLSLFEGPRTPLCTLTALYAEQPDRARLEARLAEAGAYERLEIRRLPDVDWVSLSQASFQPITAGRFFVCSEAHLTSAPAAALPLVIEAGQAFGTGHHATTRGCLLALDRRARRSRPRRVLDLGCGAGVLSIAAAKRWCCPVVASDIDPIATLTTRHNARRNAAAPWIRTVTADGFHHAVFRQEKPFDLIIANILASTLIRLAPAIADHLSPRGEVILSGLLHSQEARVRAAFHHHGLVMRHRLVLEEWATLILER